MDGCCKGIFVTPKPINMKTILFYFLLSMLSLNFSAQSINLSWVKQYGGPSNIAPLGSVMDPSGAIITCGSLEGLTDFDPNAGSSTLSSNGAKDAYISKINSSGEYEWAVSFGGTTDDIAFDVAVDVSGNVFCTGEFRGTVNFNPNGTAANLTAFTGFNAFVIKFSSTGEFQWAKKFGGISSGYESGRTISVDNAGNVMSSGMFYGTVDFDPGAGVADLSFGGYYGVYISKLNSNGDYVWIKGFNGSYITPNEMEVDGDGNLYCVGYFYSTADFDPGASAYTLVGQYYDTYITKLNSQGNFVWAKQFATTYNCTTSQIAIDEQGNVYAAGGFDGTTDFNPDLVATETITNTTYTYRAFLVKLNSSGLFQWVKQLSPNSTSRAFGVKKDNSGNLYVAGTFKGTSDFNPDALGEYPMSSVTLYYEDVFITKLTGSGDFVSAQSFGGDNSDFVNGMMMNPANGMFVLSGSFLGTCDFDPSSNATSLTSAGLADAYIARFVQCAAINETVEADGCGSYDYNGTIYTQSGTYEHILTSVGGCDSIVTLNLTIHVDSYSNVQLYAIDEIEYNGQVYSSEGDYVQTTENMFGCDSLIYINVDMMEMSFDLQNNNGVLSGGQQGNAYQWIDCNNNNSPISGATNSTFAPTSSGSFAVIVYGNNGSVTSDCIDFVYISVDEWDADFVNVYPNPCANTLYFTADRNEHQFVEVLDVCGRVFLRQAIISGQNQLNLTEAPSGTYFLRLIGEREASGKFVKTY
jgi:hypothetical protein